MLYTAQNQVAPPSGMLERLQTIDPGFGLLYGHKSKCWHITLDWTENDPRMALVRSQEVPKARAFDIFTQLPADCSADEAFGYLVRTLKRSTGKAGVQQMLDRVDAYNRKVREDALKPHRELADELIETNAKTLFRDLGKHVPKTRAPRSTTNHDERKLRDWMHDHGHVVTR